MDHAENKQEVSQRTRSRKMLLDMIHIALFAAIIAVCSQIQLPLGPVPFTLQTLGVFVAAGLLGMKKGVLSVLIYVLLGAVGLPVYAGFSGGFSTLTGPTGGYIIGFLFTALAVGLMTQLLGQKIWVLAVSMVAGLALCYVFGTAWFLVVMNATGTGMDLATALSYCVIPFLIPDAAKIAVSTILVNRLGKILKLSR